MAKGHVGVGLLGCGTVGSALVQLIAEESGHIAARTGLDFTVVAAAVRNPDKARSVPVELTSDAAALVANDDVAVVVELMGGIEPAKTLITQALTLGKPVVTGNKELIAAAGNELLVLAAEHDTVLLFEAAVGGGIPVMRPLRESLAGEPIEKVMGIVNGTTNYILTRMTEEGADYGKVLAEAQSIGYAEADPTADVEAFDAAAKARILANVAFGANVSSDDVFREGISNVSADDIESAQRLGFVVKLLAVVEKSEDSRVGVRVHPTMVPNDHPLASVRLSFNALFVQGKAVGDLMFYGRGAGGEPTASAVLGDLIDAARNDGASYVAESNVQAWPFDEQASAFCVSLDVSDKPGVLAAVAGLFAKFDISIRSMEQVGLADEAKLIFITHAAREGAMAECLGELEALEPVRRLGTVMRVLEA